MHRDEYEQALANLEKRESDGDLNPDDVDAIRELAAAYDPEDPEVGLPGDMYDGRRKDGHKARTTLAAWVNRLTTAGCHLTLTDATAADINAMTSRLVRGDDGPGATSVLNIEKALSKFYRYHDALGVDPTAIDFHEADPTEWTARDLLDADERLAMRTVADHPRDLAVYHLALYACGMRNTAIRTLRIRDIKLDNHEFYFNTSADGLKGIYQPREPRPLMQAERAVREWLDYHPTGDRDHYLITGMPKWARTDPTEPVSRETIRRIPEKLKERTAERADVATVSKPVNPHFLRHNFVSMARRHPDITDAEIKFWLGHAPESSIMESTYSHLTTKDRNAAGHTAYGTRSAADDQDVDREPWDTTCNFCDRVLHPEKDKCEACGTARGETPWDVEEAPRSEKKIRDAVRETIAEMFGVDLDSANLSERGDVGAAHLAVLDGNDDLPNPDPLEDLLEHTDITKGEFAELRQEGPKVLTEEEIAERRRERPDG